jgi:hypothetical protein
MPQLRGNEPILVLNRIVPGKSYRENGKMTCFEEENPSFKNLDFH